MSSYLWRLFLLLAEPVFSGSKIAVTRRRNRGLGLRQAEVFEKRVLLAASFDIVVDYSLDTNDFFDVNTADGLAARERLEAAAQIYESLFQDTLSAITPSGSNTWSAILTHPGTGASHNLSNLSVGANEVIIYAGGRELGGSTLGRGGPGGFSASGTQDWLNTIRARGEAGALGASSSLTDFAPWGGSVTFDVTTNWNFDATDPVSGESDFFSVAIHEIGHLLGFGTADSYENLISGSSFTGTASRVVNGNTNPPLDSDPAHWEDDLTSTLSGVTGSFETNMDPTITIGTRKLLTELDIAGFDDIGWEVSRVAAGLDIAQSNGTTEVTEGGATDVLSFSLLRPANAAVSITFTPDNQLDLGSGAGIAHTVTISPGHGMAKFTINVTAVNDSLFELSHTGNISVATTSADSHFNDLNLSDITVLITDNEVSQTRSSLAGFVNGNWWVSNDNVGGEYTTSQWADWPDTVLLNAVKGDFNGDGLEDVAGWRTNGEWRIGLANINGSFSYERWSSWRTNDIKEIHAGDFNNDGRTDLIALFKSGTKGNWWVFESTGTGFIATIWGNFASYDAIADVQVGDFDGVAGTDIAVLHTGGAWWVYLADTVNKNFDVTSWGRWNISGGVSHLQTGDFDGDGRDDIAGLFGTGSSRNWWVALSDGTIFTNQRWTSWTVNGTLDAVVSGDFNGDGKTDIAGLFNGINWWVGLANSSQARFDNSLWASWSFGVNGLSDIQVGYSNTDNRVDIFARRNDNGSWMALQSTGLLFETLTLVRWSTTAAFAPVFVGQFYNLSLTGT